MSMNKGDEGTIWRTLKTEVELLRKRIHGHIDQHAEQVQEHPTAELHSWMESHIRNHDDVWKAFKRLEEKTSAQIDRIDRISEALDDHLGCHKDNADAAVTEIEDHNRRLTRLESAMATRLSRMQRRAELGGAKRADDDPACICHGVPGDEPYCPKHGGEPMDPAPNEVEFSPFPGVKGKFRVHTPDETTEFASIPHDAKDKILTTPARPFLDIAERCDNDFWSGGVNGYGMARSERITRIEAACAEAVEGVAKELQYARRDRDIFKNGQDHNQRLYNEASNKVENLQAEVEKSRAAELELGNEVAAVNEDRHRLEAEVARLEMEHRKERDKLRRDLAALQSDVRAAKAELATEKHLHAKDRDEVGRAWAAHGREKDARRAVEKQIVDTKAEVERLEEENESTKKLYERAVTSNARLRAEQPGGEVDLDDAAKKIERLFYPLTMTEFDAVKTILCRIARPMKVPSVEEMAERIRGCDCVIAGNFQEDALVCGPEDAAITIHALLTEKGGTEDEDT